MEDSHEHEEVDTLHAAAIPRSASDTIFNSIGRIEIEKIEDNKKVISLGTGFFLMANIKGNKYKFLLTNFHVIEKKDVESRKEFNIFYGPKDNETQRTIKLDTNYRFIRCFEKPKDITLIEIIESDNIPEKKFLFPDLNYKNGFNSYSSENFYLAGYPSPASNKYEEHICSRKIVKIRGFEFDHSLDTKKGSSGSPICLIYNQNVIGIHKSGDYKNNINYGTFIGIILDIN